MFLKCFLILISMFSTTMNRDECKSTMSWFIYIFFSAGHFNDGNLRHGSLDGRRVACLLASIRSLYVRYSLRHRWRFYVNLLTTGHDRHCRLRGTNKRTTHHGTRETASTDTDRPPSSWHSERSNFQRISSTKRMKGENEYGNKCKVQ